MQQLEPAYLLHARPYRNTSLLVDFFTLKHGRVNGVLRGARGDNSKSQNKLRGIVQPFIPLEISWTGKSELVAIRHVEPANSYHSLNGNAILYGFYINELMARLVHMHDAHEDLYFAYEKLLNNLSESSFHEAQLRIFEKRLLLNLGYALPLTHECNSEVEVVAESWYHFTPDQGPQRVDSQTTVSDLAISGASLLALDREELTEIQALRDAKRLMRQALGRLLGNKPLKSRELFI